MHETGVGRIRRLLMFLKVVVHFQIKEVILQIPL
jgi:hypothetical protein